MSKHIDCLVEFCKTQPFDVEKIRNYISENKMNSEDITRAAILLCDLAWGCYFDYLNKYNKEPKPEELPICNWETLFDIFIENGLDANLVFSDEYGDENILSSLSCVDYGDLGAKIARNILEKGGNPNVIVDGVPFFQEIDSNFLIDTEMEILEEKYQIDNAFYFWLMLVGYGGLTQYRKLPVNMIGNISPDVFKDFEKYDYNIYRNGRDFYILIFDKETKRIVATV